MTLVIDAQTAGDQVSNAACERAPAPEALFPEAEIHRRFRRARRAVVFAVVLVGGGTAWAVAASGSGNAMPPFGLSSGEFSSSVGYATAHSSTARIAVAEDASTSRCVERHQPITAGVVDFTDAAIFLEWPTSACGASPGALRTKSEIVGGKGYVYFPSTTPSGKKGPDVWHALLGSPENATSFFEPVGQVVSTEPWKMLDAITGSLRRVGASRVRGTETTEYRGNASLGSVIATYPSVRHMNGVDASTPLSGLMVPVDKVRIPVAVWLDSQHRIRRLELSEPYYEANIPHTNGEKIPGFDLSPTESVPRIIGQYGTSPKQRETVHLTNFRTIGTFRLEVDLYDFGTDVRVTAPNTTHVAAG